MVGSSQLEGLQASLRPYQDKILAGANDVLPEWQIATILAEALFGVTNQDPANRNTKLVELRDYGQIDAVGPFKYSGQAGTMLKEGLMPQDVHDGLKELGIDRHVGPSYLRVKGLLTELELREFFGAQMAFTILNYLACKPPEKDGFVVCVPNMTGGAWIGDETMRQLIRITSPYDIWPATPYARGARKAVDALPTDARLVDYVEGMMPSPDETSVVVCFEELRTACETTRNAIEIDRRFGYDGDNQVRVVAASVFDYRHPVGLARLASMDVDGVYLVSGRAFLDASEYLGRVSESQHKTGSDWLSDPWDFTRRILPGMKKLAGKA